MLAVLVVGSGCPSKPQETTPSRQDKASFDDRFTEIGGMTLNLGLDASDSCEGNTDPAHVAAVLQQRLDSRRADARLTVKPEKAFELSIIGVTRANKADWVRFLTRSGQIHVGPVHENATSLLQDGVTQLLARNKRVERIHNAPGNRLGTYLQSTDMAALKRVTKELVALALLPEDTRVVVEESFVPGGQHRTVLVKAVKNPPADGILTQEHIERARREVDESGRPVVIAVLTPEGRAIFADFTRRHAQQRMAIVVENQLLGAPVIAEAITGGQLHLGIPGLAGPDLEQRADELATLIGGGELPTCVHERSSILLSRGR